MILAAAYLVVDWPWQIYRAHTRAILDLQVKDMASAKGGSARYGTPDNVILTLFSAGRERLAEARSVRSGAIAAVDPDPTVGTCSQYESWADHQGSQADYIYCFNRYAAWCGQWARDVRTADIVVGDCSLQQVPVHVEIKSKDTSFRAWLNSWVPLPFRRPHDYYYPSRYVELSIAIDSRHCRIEKNDD